MHVTVSVTCYACQKILVRPSRRFWTTTVGFPKTKHIFFKKKRDFFKFSKKKIIVNKNWDFFQIFGENVFFSENSNFSFSIWIFNWFGGQGVFNWKFRLRRKKIEFSEKNIFPENLTKNLNFFDYFFFENLKKISIFSTGEPLTRVAFRVCAADLRITR